MEPLKGIDVSAWQGDIDWQKVKADGIQFAMLRVCAGTNVDRYFVRNIQAAAKNNIPCGVYVYSYATSTDMAKKEAEVALKAIAPYKIDYPVVYDIEDKAQQSLTNTQRTDLIEAFCKRVQEAGYLAGVYSSLSWFKTNFVLGRLLKYEKWIAQWGPSKCSFSGDFSIWQNSDSGRVAGISGNVDTNICYVDYLNKKVQQPTQPDQPVNNTVQQPSSAATGQAPSTTPVSAKPPQTQTAPSPLLKAGTRLTLKNVPLYASATAATKASDVNGTYWVFDGVVLNGRIRITNKVENVGKAPIGIFVTGFINQTDVR